MSLEAKMRYAAEWDRKCARESSPRMMTVQYGEAGDIQVEVDSLTCAVESVFIGPMASVADITYDLEAGSGTWEQRRRWYWWLASLAEEPRECYLDEEGLKVFREVYDADAVDRWIKAGGVAR